MKKRRNKLESALAVLEQQGLLLDIHEHEVEREARETKQCTGALLLKRDPESYQAITVALAANKPVRWIKRTFGVGTQTVYAIQQREREKVGTLKQRIADWAFLGATAGSARFAELVADCDDVMQVAIATKTMAELGNLMLGQATQITEQRVVSVNANDLAATMARQAQEMGCGAREFSALPAESGRAPLALDPGQDRPPVDIESAVITGQDAERDSLRDNPPGDRARACDQETRADAPDAHRGGGAGAGAGGSAS